MSRSAGDRVAIRRKIAAKYDTTTEKEVISWFDQLVGIKLDPGIHKLEKQLKNGQALVKLAKKIQSDTPNCPQKAKDMALKLNTDLMPFKQMENIQTFLLFCENYGVPITGLFQTGDLFDGNNIQQVLSCIQQLGSECQKNNFNGQCIGPKPSEKNVREFSDQQLKAGQSVIGMQAGSNKGASQSGIVMGGARHIVDARTVRAREAAAEKQALERNESEKPAKPEPPKSKPQKSDPQKIEPLKSEPSKEETPESDPPKPKLPMSETPTSETLNADATSEESDTDDHDDEEQNQEK